MYECLFWYLDKYVRMLLLQKNRGSEAKSWNDDLVVELELRSCGLVLVFSAEFVATSFVSPFVAEL